MPGLIDGNLEEMAKMPAGPASRVVVHDRRQDPCREIHFGKLAEQRGSVTQGIGRGCRSFFPGDKALVATSVSCRIP